MILDGKGVAERRNEKLKEKIDSYIEKGYRKPTFAVVMAGDNPASKSYVQNKLKASALVGIEAKLYKLEDSISEQEVLNLVDELNNDDMLDGYIVQLPLPKNVDTDKVLNRMDVKKDVDGFHVINQGLLFQGRNAMHAATPQGIVNLLETYRIDVTGLNAVVVGRSNIVGMPISKLLLDMNATVTTTHSRTKNLSAITKQADLLVVAIGKPKFITKDMVKEGAIVIDVGINRVDGKLYGDVDFEEVLKIAKYITPVPKGVGPMTINALLENVFKRYEENIHSR